MSVLISVAANQSIERHEFVQIADLLKADVVGAEQLRHQE